MLSEASFFCMVQPVIQSLDPMVMGSFSYLLCREVRPLVLGAVLCRMTYLWIRRSISPQAVVFAKTLRVVKVSTYLEQVVNLCKDELLDEFLALPN